MRLLKNQRGQMAIFIALFFQVLFVFFAMAINVGLVVHDKINLQSAADLAAYYGAGRQAEILNQMAHINYQLRQNFKLLTFRYRGLGSIGAPTHPLNPNTNDPTLFGSTNFPLPVGVCVAHPLWKEYGDFDNSASFCANTTDIPIIPSVSFGNTFGSGLDQVESDVAVLRAQLEDDCQRNSVLNFNFAARILAAYRAEGRVRKEMISRLAGLLAQTDDITDLSGGSVAQGAERTLENNLTVGNRAQIRFQFFNSMGAGGCEVQNVWLPEVKINPVLFFQDFVSNFNGAACVRNTSTAVPKPNRPFEDGRSNLPDGFVNGDFDTDPVLREIWAGEPNNESRSTLGFEKNPWCMSYVGVSATAQIRKVFSPITGTRPMKVTAYAKPFGGRMGPWYGKSWEAGSDISAPGSGGKTDPLVPTRDTDPAADTDVDIVNFSQFPGDENGFGSPQGLAAMATPRARTIIQGARRFQLDHYSHIGDPSGVQEYGDGLARNNEQLTGRPGIDAPQRELELAAIAPDAFDITYYSIEPKYYLNYFNGNTYRDNPALPEEIRVYDFGSSKATPEEEAFDVQQQVGAATAIYQGSDAQALDNFKVRNWKHLLTGWVQKGAVDYGYPDGQIGACEDNQTDPSFPVPGNCESGGRVGYSVKLVSKGYLARPDLPLGGQGVTGAIRNPPPDDF